jgi:two-component system chemotaxis response regulator CheB
MVLTKAVTEITDKKPVEPLQRRRKASGASEKSMNGNNDDDRSATPSNFSCPDCGGVLRRIEDNKMLRFRCRVGHALSSSTLHAAQSDNVDQALWTALRALEEKAELARKMRDYSVERNLKAAPEKFENEAKKLEADAGVIRQLLKNTESSEVA